MASQISRNALSGALDEAILALTAFDATRLEAVEQSLLTMPAVPLGSDRKLLPEIVKKHVLLGQLLAATSANLKVLASVLNLESRMELR